MTSNWQKALEEYQKLEQGGRLDEIEPVSVEVQRKAKKVARAIVELDQHDV